MKDISAEIGRLEIDDAQEYDLIVVDSVKRWIGGELDNIHEPKVYAMLLTYGTGRDDRGAEFPEIRLGFNSEKSLAESGADKFDTEGFMEKNMSVMDDFGAVDMWLELKGYSRDDGERIVEMLGEAVRQLHEDNVIKERFMRDIPVIIAGDASSEMLEMVNKKANSGYCPEFCA
ncbi:MAG: hypothetical protein ACI4KF_10675 [Huintestinicola sp.]